VAEKCTTTFVLFQPAALGVGVIVAVILVALVGRFYGGRAVTRGT